jgi:hypothetical protein
MRGFSRLAKITVDVVAGETVTDVATTKFCWSMQSGTVYLLVKKIYATLSFKALQIKIRRKQHRGNFIRARFMAIYGRPILVTAPISNISDVIATLTTRR